MGGFDLKDPRIRLGSGEMQKAALKAGVQGQIVITLHSDGQLSLESNLMPPMTVGALEFAKFAIIQRAGGLTNGR